MAARFQARRLFQALSLLSAMACVLLIVLWVRSYWWRDYLHGKGSSIKLSIGSSAGRLDSTLLLATKFNWPGEVPFGITNLPIKEWQKIHALESKRTGRLLEDVATIHFNLLRYEKGVNLSVPFCVPILLAAALAVALWIRWSWRFSLRALLVALTLAAVMLAMIAWATR